MDLSSAGVPPRSRFLVWLGPGANDHAAWQWATARLGARCAAPERTEHLLHSPDHTGAYSAAGWGEAGIRGFVVRDEQVGDAATRRQMRAMVGPQALVLQIVREPVEALRAEVQRARVEALAVHWVRGSGARPAAHLVRLPTPETLYDRLLPRLHVERRGRAFMSAHGRRLVLAREELGDPRSLPIRRGIEQWLGPDCSGLEWETGFLPHGADFTEALGEVSAGTIDVEGARLGVRLARASELGARPDLVELARVPSIASRVPFRVDDTPLSLVATATEFARLPRGIGRILTATSLCQHRLEEQLLPRWIERTAQIHHMLGDDLPEVAPRLAARLRQDLQNDLERLFLERPALEERWDMLMCTH